MAIRPSLISTTLKATIYLLLIAITARCANSARILVEEDTGPPVPAVAPNEDVTPPTPMVTPTEDETPPAPVVAPEEDPTPVPPPAAAATPEGDSTPVTPPAAAAPEEASNAVTAPFAVAPLASPAAGTPSSGGAAAAATSSATVKHADPHSPLSFFMHDILGGSTPSGRVVAGIVANLGVNSQLPFSKTNSAVFPINGGVPLLNGNNGITNGIINNNNLPFLAGLGGGTTSTVIQNNGNNNVVTGGNTLPFVNAGQLPAGATLQQLMFGTITVIDDQLTEGHELGSSVVGKAQGFYLASSLDGTSQTMAVTALFHGDDHDEDTLSFFGVHRTAAPESKIAIVGGTGKYENAKGYANVQTLHPTDQHTTDGVETLLQFSVYLSH